MIGPKMNALYPSGSRQERAPYIVVAIFLNDNDGRRAARALGGGGCGFEVVQLDPLHTIARFVPGEAARLKERAA